MKPRPLVCVYVASYNNAAYLPACLASIQNQTVDDIEILVIDDCSTDSSMAVLSELDDHRLRVHRNAVNQGIATVRNQAVELCRAPFITSLDADDVFWSRYKLQHELAAIRRWQDGDQTPIAYSDVIQIDARGSELYQVSTRELPATGYLFPEILDRSIMIPRDYLCLKEQIEAVGGFDDDLPIYEDWDLKIRLAERYPFVFSGVVGIGYRRHGHGLSNSPQAVQEKWLSVVRQRYAQALDA